MDLRAQTLKLVTVQGPSTIPTKITTYHFSVPNDATASVFQTAGDAESLPYVLPSPLEGPCRGAAGSPTDVATGPSRGACAGPRFGSTIVHDASGGRNQERSTLALLNLSYERRMPPLSEPARRPASFSSDGPLHGGPPGKTPPDEASTRRHLGMFATMCFFLERENWARLATWNVPPPWRGPAVSLLPGRLGT